MKPDDTNFVTQPYSTNKGGAAPRVDKPPALKPSSALVLEKKLMRKALNMLGDPPIFITYPDGTTTYSTARKPRLGMVFRNRGAIWRFIANPKLSFGEEFGAGNLQIEGDLVEFIMTAYHYRPKMHEKNWLGRTLTRVLGQQRNNSLARARTNIYHHYDVGNDFYKLWLDKELVYTCAYYPDPSATLEQAQFAKLDYVCRKLRLQPGETVVEAGCGWGALALHMAKHFGVKVKAYNVSHQQIVEANTRLKQLGLQDQVQFVEDDYRNITGTRDVFVSVGMLEHVGTACYRQLGEVIDRSLREHGRGLLHSIGQVEPEPMNPWLVKRIFPGGYTPTLRQMMEVFEPRGFDILDVENLRLHYAQTLLHWLQRYESQKDIICRMYDENFYRTWQLYLAGSRANFLNGDINLFQVLFARPGNNNLPLTRAHLYSDNANVKQDTKAWKHATS
ncbi:MAG: cyclopropane-fatty-acyl-phospholipid synthase family protein [Gammaproteobacteria bacterium]|nr:cyclopropane-fatty-acyl-phospholipid synthase family protein [Gammaproteobacteria bacterium]